MVITQTYLITNLGYSAVFANGVLKKFEQLGLKSENVQVRSITHAGRGAAPVMTIRWQRGFKLDETIDALKSYIANTPEQRINVTKWQKLIKELECEQSRQA